jgi:hypothetical protein
MEIKGSGAMEGSAAASKTNRSKFQGFPNPETSDDKNIWSARKKVAHVL